MQTLVRVVLPLVALGVVTAGLLSLSAPAGPKAEHAWSGDLEAVDRQGEAAELLAARYAPVYYVENHSSRCGPAGKRFEPAPVEMVIGGNSEIRLVTPDQTIEAPVGPQLEGLGRDSYLDLPGDPRASGCSYARLQERFSQGLEPTVYARVAQEAGRPGLALQFWAFWLFNDWNNTHEGDWELVQIQFDVDTPAEALAREPVSVAYAQHGAGERRGWHDAAVDRQGWRPVVYVASGSHASYFRPGVYVGLGEPGFGVGCDSSMGPHRRVDPRTVLVPGDPTGVSEFEWLTFRGHWGERQQGEFAGPRGPITKRAWGAPLSWAEDLRGNSSRRAEVHPLGQNSVGRLCELVSDGAWLARTVMGLPMMLGVALPLAAAGAGTTAFAVAQRPARVRRVGTRGAGFVRQRRTMPGIAWTAVRIYKERPWLFLGISLGFVPLQLLLALALARVGPVPVPGHEPGFFASSFVSRWASGLAIAGLGSVVAYVFVLGGALAAVAAIDRGEPVTVIGAYWRALRRAPHLLLARGATLVALMLLSLSVVGIPVTIWLVVRSAFIEEAILLEDRNGWRAARESARVTGGAWARAAVFVALFGAAGMTAGLIAAAVLLYLTPLDPWLVNTVAGMVHLAVVPFVAIGLSLSYGDLRQTREDSN